MRNIRTDIAAEARAYAPEATGVRQEIEERDGIETTRVWIDTQQGADALGKPIGEYVTVEAPALKDRDMHVYEKVSEVLAGAIRQMLRRKGVKAGDTVLVVGLGNRQITPDSLGPKVVEKAFVTRHLHEFLPDQVDERMRPVCAFAPGVLGITGMETGEMVKGVLERVKPKLIIAIDALASRSTERISTTVQLTDTGIHPGSGLGNRRMSLNEETLGVPVIALGVPLVVHASTLSRDAVSLLIRRTGGAETEEEEEHLLALLDEVVSEKIGPLVVTPKEIDAIVSDCSSLVARGINLALHELDIHEIEQLMS